MYNTDYFSIASLALALLQSRQMKSLLTYESLISSWTISFPHVIELYQRLGRENEKCSTTDCDM